MNVKCSKSVAESKRDAMCKSGRSAQARVPGGILEDFLEGERYEQGHGERRGDMEEKWKTRNE